MAHFNPRSPRGGATFRAGGGLHCRPLFQSTLPTRGSDGIAIGPSRYDRLFQSTLPTRGSDVNALRVSFGLDDFNPRSPRGGATGDVLVKTGRLHQISIHAPHEGERRGCRNDYKKDKLFQSTLPTRGSDSGKVHLYAAFPRIY